MAPEEHWGAGKVLSPEQGSDDNDIRFILIH